MSDSLAAFLAELRSWSPQADELPLLEGALDPHRSDERVLLFAVDPCRGAWIRIPAGAVAGVRQTGEVRCGAAVYPGVEVRLDEDAPATLPVVDAARLAAIAAGAGPGSEDDGELLAGGDEGTASRDVHLELRPEGKLYRTRIDVEGRRVRNMEWDGERGVYVAEIQGLAVEDALDVQLQGWGNEGATLTLSLEVDGEPLTPEMEATVTDRPGEARRSYRL